MSRTDRVRVGRRLPPTEAESLLRERILRFTFDGRTVEAYTGDTIASALLAAGQRTLSRSFKYHRPRGVLCAAGDCPNCLVQVGSEPNVRACQRRVEDGMQVRSQNRWPSLSRDALQLVELGDRFLPPGFYYKAFLQPKSLWPVYEGVLRRMAGLGRVDPDSKPAFREKAFRHPDVAVIGGGPAGMRAALVAAEAGAQVLLVEHDHELGGHLRYGRGQWDGRPLHRVADDLANRIANHDGVAVLMGTHLFGWYEHRWLAAASPHRLYKIRPSAVVLATGSHEVPMVFQGNDLPGIMLSGATQRLIRMWGVRPGERAVVVAPHRSGWQAAVDLQEAGVTVEVLANPAGGFDDDIAIALDRAGVALAPGMTVERATGRGQLHSVRLSAGGAERVQVECDLLVASAGFAPATALLLQAGGEVEWDQEKGEFIPKKVPAGTFLAGDVSGPVTLAETLQAGDRAGKHAAEFAADPASDTTARTLAYGDDPASYRPRTISPLAPSMAKKSFVCLCEDVTRADLAGSIDEGYDGLELLKRYSTVSMGPCQGKMCHLASIQLCAVDTGRSVPETGRTTSRPPARPVAMGILAGRPMEPVRRTPMHNWHEEQGARMMVAGAWMRPEHYGDPIAEVRAVRERAGLIDVSTLGKFHLHGTEVPELLERIYTNRWRRLPVGRVRYGLMAREEGVVLDDGVTARLSDDLYYLTTTSSGAGRVYQWIEWWRQSVWGYSLHVHEATELRAAMNLTGPQARAVLEKVCSGIDLDSQAFPYMHARKGEIAGAPALVLRIGFTGELGYEIHTPSGYGLHVWQAILEAGAPHGIRPFGVEAQRVLRLEKGHIIVGQDTDSLSDPLEAGMSWAVKFEKEDFLGRAFLREAQQAGLERKLVGFEVPGGTVPEEANQLVRPGDGPLGLQIIGRVTSARWSPTLERVIGLAWVPASMAEPGTALQIRSRGKLLGAVVRELPFYDPAGERLRT